MDKADFVTTPSVWAQIRPGDIWVSKELATTTGWKFFLVLNRSDPESDEGLRVLWFNPPEQTAGLDWLWYWEVEWVTENFVNLYHDLR